MICFSMNGAHIQCVYLKIRKHGHGVLEICRKRAARSCPQMKESGTSKLKMHDGLAYTLDMHTPGLHRKRFILFACFAPLFLYRNVCTLKGLGPVVEWIGCISCKVSMEQSRLEPVRPSCQSFSDAQYIQNFSIATELHFFLFFYIFLCAETALTTLNNVRHFSCPKSNLYILDKVCRNNAK